jgi:hypothetical protein
VIREMPAGLSVRTQTTRGAVVVGRVVEERTRFEARR